MLSRIVCNSVSTRMGTRGSGISIQLKLGPPLLVYFLFCVIEFVF